MKNTLLNKKSSLLGPVFKASPLGGLVGLVLLSSVAVAQTPKNELSISAGGGLSGINYKPTVGEQSNGFGGNFGLGYAYFFTKNIGIGTGLELGLYNTSFKGDFNHVINNITDPASGLVFDLRLQVSNYEETQQAMYLNIPLMLQYQLPVMKENQFYAAAGVKVGVPLSGSYETSQADFYNTGYFQQSGNELDAPKFMGFGNFNKTNSGDLPLNTSFALALEAGMKWKLNENMFLYTGLYFDYGLNNIISDDNTKDFIAYNPAQGDQFSSNSIVTSSYTDKANLLSFGVKLRFSLGKGFIKDKAAQAVRQAEKEAESQRQAAEQERLKAEKESAKKAQETADSKAKKEAEEARIKVEQEAAAKAKQTAEQAEKERQQKAEQQRAGKEYAKVQEVIAMPVTDFDVNSTQLTPAMEALLDEKAEMLKANPKLNIICEGHTCDIGSDEVNERIGMERAQAAKTYLIKKGVEAKRIRTVSKSKTNPIVPNNSEENRRKNRRVVFVITE